MEKPLIDEAQAGELVALFKVLVNDSRLLLVHALERAGELCVTNLPAEVGMTPQTVSNQPQRLIDRRMLVGSGWQGVRDSSRSEATIAARPVAVGAHRHPGAPRGRTALDQGALEARSQVGPAS